MYPMIYFSLWEQCWPILIERLALCLPHIVPQTRSRRAHQEVYHANPKKSFRIAHAEEIPILGLSEDAEIDGSNILVASIDGAGAVAHKSQAGELLQALL